MNLHRAAAISPLILLLAACNTQGDASHQGGSSPEGAAATSQSPGTSADGGAATPAPSGGSTSGASSPGSVPGSDTAKVDITSCKAVKSGVEVEVSLKNTTKEERTYIVAVEVKDGDKRIGGAPAMASNVKPGASTTATAEVTGKVAKPTCSIANIGAVAG